MKNNISKVFTGKNIATIYKMLYISVQYLMPRQNRANGIMRKKTRVKPCSNQLGEPDMTTQTQKENFASAVALINKATTGAELHRCRS